MADYDVAYDITLAHEGGYDNDPDDAGGETYKGVARKYYPTWAGWAIIDAAKEEPNFPESLKDNIVLDSMIREFYKINYWNRIGGDDLSEQLLANELFDTGVNMGVSRAVEFLQKALNVLNRSGKLYDDIGEDGKFGNDTINALSAYLSTDSVNLLLKIINVLQGMHYITYMTKSPTQEKYARGWFNRVEFVKK
jgi:lysozyme family protein